MEIWLKRLSSIFFVLGAVLAIAKFIFDYEILHFKVIIITLSAIAFILGVLYDRANKKNKV